jgi:DNA topoisomerase-1
VTTDLMKENFADVVDYGFTAQMEEQLDGIENGREDMLRILDDFYAPFASTLDKAMKEADEKKIELPPEETDIICDKCGARMIVKNGRFGKFAACPNYPDCKNTKQLAKDGKSAKEDKAPAPAAGMTCEKCGGPMVMRQGRYGSFFACAAYPKCTYTKQPQNELDVSCPLCGKTVVSKRGRNKGIFYSCSGYPECSFSSWDLPTNEKCPNCGSMLFHKKNKGLLICGDKDCKYSCKAPEEIEQAVDGAEEV